MLEKFLKNFFPKRCLNCNIWDEFLCEECFRTLKFLKDQRCPYCNQPSLGGITHDPRCTHLPNKDPRKWHLNGVLSALEYDSLAKKLVGEFKYYPQVKDLREVIEKIFLRYFIPEEEYFRYDTVVTAVPLHPRRQRERGFNQAKIIAQILAGLWGLKTDFDLLERHRHTGQQMGLKRDQRFENVLGAFRLKKSQLPNAYSLTPIILVDDVWTTGATLKECCKVLRRNGVPEVWAVTLARD